MNNCPCCVIICGPHCHSLTGNRKERDFTKHFSEIIKDFQKSINEAKKKEIHNGKKN